MEEQIEQEKKKRKTFKQKHADWSLGIISFIESAFFPILTDPFLLGMTIAKPRMWFRYTMIAGVTSVLGGLFGYFLGAVFFDLVGEQLIAFYNAEDLFEKTVESVNKGAFIFTLIGAFTPVPYKLVAIIGGMLHINIFAFVIASIVGRFSRFILVTYISSKFGEYALTRFHKHIKIASIAAAAGILLYLAMLIH